MSIIVLVGDSQRLFADALAFALQRRFDIGVLDSRPSSWAEAIDEIEALRPEVALLDYWMFGSDPPAAVQEIRTRSPESRLLITSALLSHQQISEMLAAGAAGCLPKTADLESVAEAVRRAYAGESPVYAEKLQNLIDVLDRRHNTSVQAAKKLKTLTRREIQILLALNSGLPVKDLADQLSISPETVKAHIKSILAKTGAKSQAQVVLMARNSGFMQG